MRTLVLRNENASFQVRYKTDREDPNTNRFTIMQVDGLTETAIHAGLPTLELESDIFAFKKLATDLNLQLVESTPGAETEIIPIATNLAFTSNPTLTSGTHSVAYAGETLAAEGGSGVYTFAVTGGDALPTGMSMTSAGVISGTPGGSTAGTYHPHITVTDSYGMSVTVTFTLVIA